jgi:hypothetical protein
MMSIPVLRRRHASNWWRKCSESWDPTGRFRKYRPAQASPTANGVLIRYNPLVSCFLFLFFQPFRFTSIP